MKILFSHYAIIDKEGFSRSFMLARELAKQGNEVTFLTTLPSSEFIFPYKKELRYNVKIIAFPDFVPDSLRRTGFGVLSVLLRVIFILFSKYELYHADVGHRPSGGWPIIFKKAFCNVLYVSEWWDYFGKGGQYDMKKGFKKITHGYYDLLFETLEKKIADGIVCLSHEMKKRAVKIGISKKKITIVTGGADCCTIKYYPNTFYKEKFGIPKNSVTFGFSGMKKGELPDIIPFIKATKVLLNKSINITWFTTGDYISEEIKKEFQIGEELFEFGWVNYKEYSEIISCADVFILLQKEDIKNKTRWPNKLGDYLAAGRPILINPYGDTKKLVAQKEDFFLKTEFNVADIVDTIENNLDFNSSLLNSSIRAFAEKEFSWEHKSKKLLDFYRSIIYEEKI